MNTKKWQGKVVIAQRMCVPTSVSQSLMSSQVSVLFLAMASENIGREGTVKRKHGFLGLETELFPTSVTQNDLSCND